MKITTLTTILLSSVLVISCGKKDDLNTVDDNTNNASPIIEVGDNNNCIDCDKDMTLTKTNSSYIKDNIDSTKSYKNDGPTFDSGIRPTNSK